MTVGPRSWVSPQRGPRDARVRDAPRGRHLLPRCRCGKLTTQETIHVIDADLAVIGPWFPPPLPAGISGGECVTCQPSAGWAPALGPSPRLRGRWGCLAAPRAAPPLA